MIAIILFGNIASGKTTIARGLQQQLDGFEHFCVNEYREEAYRNNLSTRSSLSEIEAALQQALLQDLLQHKQIIFETLGTSIFGTEVINKIKANYDLVYTIFVDCMPLTCIRRYAERPHGQYLLYFPNSGNTKDFIYRLNLVLMKEPHDLRVWTDDGISIHDTITDILDRLQPIVNTMSNDVE